MGNTCSGEPTGVSEPGALLHARSLGVTVYLVGACPGPPHPWGDGGRRPSRVMGRGESVSVLRTCECGPNVVTVWQPDSQPGTVSVGTPVCPSVCWCPRLRPVRVLSDKL